MTLTTPGGGASAGAFSSSSIVVGIAAMLLDVSRHGRGYKDRRNAEYHARSQRCKKNCSTMTIERCFSANALKKDIAAKKYRPTFGSSHGLAVAAASSLPVESMGIGQCN